MYKLYTYDAHIGIPPSLSISWDELVHAHKQIRAPAHTNRNPKSHVVDWARSGWNAMQRWIGVEELLRADPGGIMKKVKEKKCAPKSLDRRLKTSDTQGNSTS